MGSLGTHMHTHLKTTKNSFFFFLAKKALKYHQKMGGKYCHHQVPPTWGIFSDWTILLQVLHEGPQKKAPPVGV